MALTKKKSIILNHSKMTTQLDNANAVVAVLQNRANAGDFSGDLNNLIVGQQVSIKETTDYIAKKISGAGGTINLVEASTDRKEGVSTFNGNKFQQNIAKVIDAVQISIGKGDPSNMGGIKFDQAAPAELLNAHLIVEQNGRKLLEKKVSDFIPEGTETAGSDLFTELALPLIIRDVEDFDIKLKFPSGSSLGSAGTVADTINTKVAFRSYETGRKA